jgi:hypothetical protein
MAIMKLGILGNTSGCIGSIEGARWRGRDVYKGRKRESFIDPSSKQVVQRSSFANCRSVLSKLRSFILDIGVGNGSRSLPAWPMLIERVARSFPSGTNWFGSSPQLLVVKHGFAPSLFNWSWYNDGDYVRFSIEFSKTIPFGDRKLFYCVYVSENGDFEILPTQSSSFVPFFNFDMLRTRITNRTIVVWAYYAIPGVDSSAYSSSVLVFLSPVG